MKNFTPLQSNLICINLSNCFRGIFCFFISICLYGFTASSSLNAQNNCQNDFQVTATFDYSVMGGVLQTATLNSNGVLDASEEITIDICNGESYNWNPISSNVTRCYISQLLSNGNVVGIPSSPPPDEIILVDDIITNLNLNIFNGSPLSLSLVNPNLLGTITQKVIFYSDEDGDDAFNPSFDCYGDTMVINYIVRPQPGLIAQMNNTDLISSANGVTDVSTFAVCSGVNNNVQITAAFQELNNMPNAKLFQTFSLVNATLSNYCNNCAAAIPLFVPPTAAMASLVNSSLPGSVILNFIPWFDRDNNNVIDSDECTGDTARYIINIGVPPTIQCPAAVIVGCAADVASRVPVNTTDVTVLTNNCTSPAIIGHLSDVITNRICDNQFTILRTYRASNSCCPGSFANCVQTIIVKDSIGPSSICPATTSVVCTANVPAPNPALLIIADDCGNINLQRAFVEDSIGNLSCPNKYLITRKYSATDQCGNSKICRQLISVNDNIIPVARCRDLTVNLDGAGNAEINSIDLENGSTDNCAAGIASYLVNDSTFTCDDIGGNSIQLTVTDACGNTDTEICTVTVRDIQFPVLTCPANRTFNLTPGECGRVINYQEPDATDNCDVTVSQIDATGLTNGSFFPIGTTCLEYRAIDEAGNSVECRFCYTLIEYPKTRFELVCNDDVQISLDDSCRATINADMVLEGDIYGCYDGYIVQLRDWAGGPRSPIIDREPLRRGAQVNYLDIGRMLLITIIDPVTGNSCWGIGVVRDKLPPILICPNDTAVLCTSSLLPEAVGLANVHENCGSFDLTYKDTERKGSCELGFDKIITRVFTAVDISGNTSSCTQIITVNYATLADVAFPPQFTVTDGIFAPGYRAALKCDEKIDKTFDLQAHLKDAPECVDDYLLDVAFYDRYSIRRPRTLGWNCIDAGINNGNPSPYDVFYPPHYDVNSCYGTNEVIMWHGTGVPHIQGCVNLAMSFTDVKIESSSPSCNAGDIGCYKIIRKWTILDWCTGSVLDSNQLIKVVDLAGPEIVYPDRIEIITDVWQCVGRWDVSKIWVSDNCSFDVNYSIWIENGTVLGNQKTGYVVVDIPVGLNRAIIIAEDCCGNITEKEIWVEVLDNVPPTAICEQRTTVTMTGNLSPDENFAKVFAETFDDGSFDNCASHIFFKIIRMDELLGTNNGSKKGNGNFCRGANGDDDLNTPGNQIYFDDFTKLCCEDVDNIVLVVFRVFDIDPGVGPIDPARMSQGGDLFGHFSDCMVEVLVQDKSVPVVVAPPDIVISCDVWIDENRLTDPDDSLFGKVVKDIAWRKKVVTKDIVCSAYCERNDLTGYPGFIVGRPAHLQPVSNIACNYYNTLFQPAHPDQTYELLWGFDGYVITSCGVEPRIVVRDERECGQGRILRDIIATGPGGVTVRATQTIWVVNCDPFWSNRENHCDDTDDIIWPDCKGTGTTVYGCGVDVSPEKIGMPILLQDQKDHCSLLAVEHFDQVFTIETDVCYKILRKWVVIDWCQYDPNIDPYRGRWEHGQWIMVNDRIAPIVTCTMGPCEPAVKSPNLGTCFAHIVLTATAVDSCTPNDWLKFEYKIDAFNDGTYDFAVGSLTQSEYNRGILPAIRNNPLADNSGNPFNASGTYPIGIHRIKWFVEDGCGNIGFCEKLFEIKDCKAPTPYCLTGIITVPMQTSGCVDIWAKDLDAGSFDNCTDRSRLKFYFANDPDSTYMRVCCADFVRARENHEITIPVQVCIEDEEGNKDCCNTSVTVQDPQNICPDVPTVNRAKITGIIKTEYGIETGQVFVDLMQNGKVEKSVTTNADGSYAFYSLPLGEEFLINPVRNDNPLNGVTTADIVRIQRHILGIDYLKTPYKLIAADVNGSKSITAADMADIRKLILGTSERFAKVDSWMFVDKALAFTNMQKPWNDILISPIKLIKEDNEFNLVSVKMGDVNESVVVNAKNNTTTKRARQAFKVLVEDNKVQTGDEVMVSFYSAQEFVLSGMQLALEFNKDVIDIIQLTSPQFEITADKYRIVDQYLSQLRISWNQENSFRINTQLPLFNIKVRVKKSVSTSQLFKLNTESMLAQVYDNDLQEYDMTIEQKAISGSFPQDEFALYAAVPNPVYQEAVIHYSLPYDSPVELSFYDVNGKIIARYQLDGRRGMNHFGFHKDDLGINGLLYFQLDAKDHSATQKIIIME